VGFVDTILVSTLKSMSTVHFEFVQAVLTGRIRYYAADRQSSSAVGFDDDGANLVAPLDSRVRGGSLV
jgi:hypothetical protein